MLRLAPPKQHLFFVMCRSQILTEETHQHDPAISVAHDEAYLLHQRRPSARDLSGFFYFYIFYFRFLQKYIFVFEIYRNIPGRPAAGRPGPGRPAAGRQRLLCKTFCENICAQVPRGRSPCSGAAGPGCPAAGRPAVIFTI